MIVTAFVGLGVVPTSFGMRCIVTRPPSLMIPPFVSTSDCSDPLKVVDSPDEASSRSITRVTDERSWRMKSPHAAEAPVFADVAKRQS